MSKMNELSMLLDDLITCGNKLTQAAQALRDFYSDTAEAPPTAQETELQAVPAEAVAPPAPAYTKEQVRAILARKSREDDGRYKAEVRAAVRKYADGGTLTNVDPKDYAALVAEAEVIGHAR